MGMDTSFGRREANDFKHATRKFEKFLPPYRVEKAKSFTLIMLII